MVRVITIMDDVYAELHRLKKQKGMSFTEIIRYLLKERESANKNMMAFAGSLSEYDLDRRYMKKLKL